MRRKMSTMLMLTADVWNMATETVEYAIRRTALLFQPKPTLAQIIGAITYKYDAKAPLKDPNAN